MFGSSTVRFACGTKRSTRASSDCPIAKRGSSAATPPATPARRTDRRFMMCPLLIDHLEHVGFRNLLQGDTGRLPCPASRHRSASAMMREYRPMAAPLVERGLADPTDHVLFRGCHGVLDRTADGVDPQNAQPALHCDRGRDAADAVWRAVSGCGAQGQRPGAGLCREPAL